jgi:hypothetical protein
MIRLQAFSVLAALSIGTTLAAQAPTAPSAPNRPAVAPPASGPILADPPGVNFGVVRPETTVEATIKLLNPLDHPVRIVKAVPSCQCTTIDMENKIIPARGMIEMPMSMKTAKSVGKRSANVSLAFEGLRQVLLVTIECETALPIRANPPFIDALAADRMKGSFEVASQDGKPFRIVAVDGKPPVSVGGDPSGAARASHRLAYDFTAPGSAVPKYVLVETDREDCPIVDLRVRHDSTRIKPPFKVAEFRSSAGRIVPGGRGSFELEIEKIGTVPVAGVRSLSPDATVRLETQKSDGTNTLITVEVTPRAGFEGLLTFPVEITVGTQKYAHLVFASVRPPPAAVGRPVATP